MRIRAIITAAALSIGQACSQEKLTAVNTAHVTYVLDAPLCSSILPVEFRIDQRLVATDTFRVNLAPSHTQSALFATTAGTHVIGARVVFSSGHYYTWTDTTVSIAANATFTDTLGFYCS